MLQQLPLREPDFLGDLSFLDSFLLPQEQRFPDKLWSEQSGGHSPVAGTVLEGVYSI